MNESNKTFTFTVNQLMALITGITLSMFFAGAFSFRERKPVIDELVSVQTIEIPDSVKQKVKEKKLKQIEMADSIFVILANIGKLVEEKCPELFKKPKKNE